MKKILIGATVATIASALSPLTAFASEVTADATTVSDANKPLTDLFATTAFSGSWEVFSKFNWLGGAMQFIISAFCLLGLFLICYQRLITMLYLSSRSTFDKVDEIKKAGHGQKFFGMGTIGRDIFNAQHGTGLDALVSFGLSLLPNIKAYSDYNEERRAYNLNEDDSVTTYMLKVAIPTIMLIFFFAIGFNGTMFKAYGVVVDGMATAANTMVDAGLSTTVDKWMNSGAAYQFGYDSSTEMGKFKQALAKKMYSKVLSKSNNLSADVKQQVGAAIDKWVTDNVGVDAGKSKFVAGGVTGFKGTDKDCANLSSAVTINQFGDYGTEFGGKAVELSKLGLAVEKWYLHVYISRDEQAATYNYFDAKESTTNDNTPGQNTGAK